MSEPLCASLVESYVAWLREGIAATAIDGVCEITTPFLDRHNDHLQIYVEQTDHGYRLSDDAYTIEDLRASGVDLASTGRRAELLESVTRGFGVQVDGNALVVDATPQDFARKKHNLVQAMLAVNDLFVLARPTVASVFREDVERFLSENDVRFAPRVGIPGRSGLDQHFHLVIPASRTHPERLVESVSDLTRQRLSALVFQWTDVRPNRANAEMHVFLSDDDPPREDLISAMRAYEMNPILWSRREDQVERLAN